MNGVSLIICCHNSVDKLPPTIKHVNELAVSKNISWELIVVDNASTDGTSEIAANLLSVELKSSVKIVTENELGLRHARLKGISVSKYEYICFIDDDNWICPEWVNTVYEIMSGHPEVGACGGVGLPSFESTPPKWFEQYAGCYAVGSQGESTGYVADSRGYLWGAGLTVRRSAWDELIANGFTFTLSGRHGTNLSSGEDSEICFALRCYGWRLWYDEKLCYYHYLPPSRLTWSYLKKLYRGFGASEVVLGAYREFIDTNIENPIIFHNSWKSDALSIIKLYRNRYMHLLLLCREKENSEKTIEFHWNFGKLWAILCLRNRYDDIKRQIYSFWQHSKLYQERVKSIEPSINMEITDVALINSFIPPKRDETILDLQLRIYRLESSLSWRITKPLRWLGDKIRSLHSGNG